MIYGTHRQQQEAGMFSEFSLSDTHPSETTIGTTLTFSGKENYLPVYLSEIKKSREARMALRKSVSLSTGRNEQNQELSP